MMAFQLTESRHNLPGSPALKRRLKSLRLREFQWYFVPYAAANFMFPCRNKIIVPKEPCKAKSYIRYLISRGSESRRESGLGAFTEYLCLHPTRVLHA
jgi:hypothetical protein